MARDTDGLEPYVDAADRLERSLDVQINQLTDIDNKAEHVTRLVGVLIGTIITLVSLAAQVPAIEIDTSSPPVILAFAVGILLLIASMGGAIITYLSSKYKIGLHETSGNLLSRRDFDTDMDEHIRRVLGTYAYNIERNRRVIQTNAQRFRHTLLYLLLGIVYLATAGILYLSPSSPTISWTVFVIVSGYAIGSTYYILTGRYLTLYDEDQ